MQQLQAQRELEAKLKAWMADKRGRDMPSGKTIKDWNRWKDVTIVLCSSTDKTSATHILKGWKMRYGLAIQTPSLCLRKNSWEIELQWHHLQARKGQQSAFVHIDTDKRMAPELFVKAFKNTFSIPSLSVDQAKVVLERGDGLKKPDNTVGKYGPNIFQFKTKKVTNPYSYEALDWKHTGKKNAEEMERLTEALKNDDFNIAIARHSMHKVTAIYDCRYYRTVQRQRS